MRNVRLWHTSRARRRREAHTERVLELEILESRGVAAPALLSALFTEVPRIRVLQSSATEHYRKLRSYGAMLDPPTAGAATSPGRCVFWGP